MTRAVRLVVPGALALLTLLVLTATAPHAFGLDDVAGAEKLAGLERRTLSNETR